MYPGHRRESPKSTKIISLNSYVTFDIELSVVVFFLFSMKTTADTVSYVLVLLPFV